MIVKILLFLTFLLGVSCKQRSDELSKDLHEEGQLVAGRFPSYWADVSPEYHEKLVKAISKMGNPKGNSNLIWKHSMVERLQTWVDAIDKEARNTIWGRKYMSATPKPRVVLVDDESPNAFVAGALVKYQADVLVPGTNNQIEDVPLIMSLNGTPDVTAASILPQIFPVENGLKKMVGNVVDRQKFISERLGYKCLPNNDGPGKIVFKGCPVGKDQSSIQSPAYLSRQTTPYVTIHLGLLRIMNEEGAVSTIGHELGHYYRAHATDDNRLGQGGYFYYEKNAANGRKPEPIKDEGLEKLGRESITAAANRAPNAIPGTKFDSEVIMGLLNSIYHERIDSYSDLKAANFPEDADEYGFIPGYAILLRKCRVLHPQKADCDTFERALKNPDVKKVLLKEEVPNKQAYLALESAFLSFSSVLKFGSANGPDLLVDSEIIPIWGTFARKRSRNSGVGLACGSYYYSLVKESPNIPLNQLLSGCSVQIENNRKAADSLINNLVLKGIGWYTTEQEADEIAAELVASVGIDPKNATSGLWALFKYVNSRDVKVVGVNYPTCLELAKGNFGFGTGSVRTVALGDWSEVHHDLCYRIYNSSRDLFSHNYKFDVNKRPQFKSTWESEVKSLPAPKGNDIVRQLDNAFLLE